ncbi:potassium channel subfamily K member 18 [Brienomyrus brachyistius]|uniref:potassium channel subfamily K member 18 n=1 Tax=Brienomyrus brachyistius TaxID=42636 RepID=UPI0020B37996|nr:potassium channel subfamily K member 18 [Brienomyrus brachyistius]
MSCAVENRNIAERSRCSRLLWTIFPHVCLILSLVVYGCFGALVFSHIEGQSNTTKNEYNAFLHALVDTVNNSDNQELLMKKVDQITKKFNPIWLENPERWNFFGSLFFCCTVLSTVGYGKIYPVTLPGKLFCMSYAMIGIPLMLLVITDVGDVLAILLSRGYWHLHHLYKSSFCSRSFRRRREKSVEDALVHDGTYMLRQNMLIRQPMDIKEMLSQQSFNHIIAHKKPLQRSQSCPELSLISREKDTQIWEENIGRDLEKLDVPMIVILVVVFSYILFFGIILPLWETEIERLDAIYFCFITLTTIGFGDIMPQHPNYFMLTSLFLIGGMAIMSMAFKLGQNRIVSCYRKCMQCISRGQVKEYSFPESN